MTGKHYAAMAGAGGAVFILLALCAFGNALVSDVDGVFDISGGVKIALVCLGVLLGTAVAMMGAIWADA